MDDLQSKKKFVKDLEDQWGINSKVDIQSKQPILIKDIKAPEITLTQFKAKELRRLNNLKMTQAKQNKFIDLYSQFPNMTKCARQVGISLKAVRNTMERDANFKELVTACRDNISEDLKEAMVLVGSQTDARGANDRHRWLTAYDPAFKKTPEIQTNIQVNLESSGQVRSILAKILPNDD